MATLPRSYPTPALTRITNVEEEGMAEPEPTKKSKKLNRFASFCFVPMLYLFALIYLYLGLPGPQHFIYHDKWLLILSLSPHQKHAVFAMSLGGRCKVACVVEKCTYIRLFRAQCRHISSQNVLKTP